ncbi:MAG: pyridoxal phosphate-dependent aminotransferase family protein [Actinomycetota bacterium]|nr:pyridoxal phosphate-dependent aminotransferase family protein [Actinomycetota bacterium]
MTENLRAQRGTSADLFAKCSSRRVEEYRLARSVGLLPYFQEMASASGPVVTLDGHDVIMLGSNNYLGLTDDPRVKAAAIESIERYGSGCTGSRLMNGTLPVHRELEEELRDWVGGDACLVFTTGYAVNLGVISTLVGARDVVFVDAASHASIIDGARMAAGSMKSFRHNSVEALERRLREWSANAEGAAALVAVDGVYSMEGDLAPVRAIADVCTATGSRFLVDEAHALGVVGPAGAGTAAGAGVTADLVMGTFSKSLASCGGFVTGPSDVIDFLRVSCRPFLFTASGVPAALAAALAATRIARAEAWRREAVAERATQLRNGLRELGYVAGPDEGGAIVSIQIGDDWAAAQLWRTLVDAGVYTNCAVAPAVAPGRALLRTSVMATHTERHIHDALVAFEEAQSTSG